MQPGDSGLDVTGFDDERIVDLSDDPPIMDDSAIVPSRHDDEWGERWWGSDDDWLRDERPPHW